MVKVRSNALLLACRTRPGGCMLALQNHHCVLRHIIEHMHVAVLVQAAAVLTLLVVQ
jgi:hypothetical protein